jgi:short-subunit dehydrogenase involved in D-alanine esterification of teichoic acids
MNVANNTVLITGANRGIGRALVEEPEYRDVDGIIIPATRRAYAWQGDYQLVPEPLLVTIDIGKIPVR